MISVENYDTLVLDSSGQPTNGVSEPSLCGLSVQVYCNWLNVTASHLWRSGSITPTPVICTMMKGELTILDLSMVAVRGPQQGIYFACWFLHNLEPMGMTGLACYGLVDDHYVGVAPGSVKFHQDTLAHWISRKVVPPIFDALPWQSALRFNQGDALRFTNAQLPILPTPVGQAERIT